MKKFFTFCFVLGILASSLSADDRFESVIQKILSDSPLGETDLSGYKNSSDLRIVRNAIFAKHGYTFQSEDLKEYFSKMSWYKPNRSNVDESLTPTDKNNLEFVSSYELDLEIKEFTRTGGTKISRKNRDYVGFWHDSPTVAAGWGDTFAFFKNGKVIQGFNTMDCEKRLISLIGTWEVKNDTLFLVYSLKKHIEGGKLEPASGSCASEKELVGGRTKITKLNPPIKVVFALSKITIDSKSSPDRKLPLLTIGKVRYFHIEDPETR